MAINEVAPDVYRISTYIPEILFSDLFTHQGDVEPQTGSEVVDRFAIMHGSTFVGDGGQALKDLAGAMREVLGD